MAEKATIAQVAELAGVSIATVSRYINQSKGVRKVTAQRIEKAIRQLDYPLPEDVSFTEKKECSRVILINIPSVSNPFYHEVIRGIQNCAQREGYHTLVNVQHLNAGSEASFFDLLKTKSFCGAVILNALEQPFFTRLYETLPFVQCCEFTEGQQEVSYVSIDDVSAAKKMTEYLLSVGRRKIAILMGPSRYKYARHRRNGYQQALEAAGIPIRPEWIISTPDLEFDTAFSAATQLLSQSEHPDAIFAVSDVMAAAAIRACQVSGLSVPRDVAVAGFDNVPYAQMMCPPITTISQPRYHMGYTACKLLLDQLADPSCNPQQLTLNTELIIRESA